MRQIDLRLSHPIEEAQLQMLVEELGGEWDPPDHYHALGEGYIERGEGNLCVELSTPTEITLHVGGDRDAGMIDADCIVGAAKQRRQAQLVSC